MPTATTASLVAAATRRLGASGAIQPVMIGSAGEGWRQASSPWFNLTAKGTQLNGKPIINFLRMPGGTAVDYYDWYTGKIVIGSGTPPGVIAGNPTPALKLQDWLDVCANWGFEPMIEFNVCTLCSRMTGGAARYLRGSGATSPYTSGNYHDDVALLVTDNMLLLSTAIAYMQAKGKVNGIDYSNWYPKYIELGNEIYLGGTNNPGPAAAFGTNGGQYAYLAYQMALAIRSNAAWSSWAPMSASPHCRIFACGLPTVPAGSGVTYPINGSAWQNALVGWTDGNGHSVNDVVDGFTFHGEYWGNPSSTPTTAAQAWAAIQIGITKYQANGFTATSKPVSGLTTLPAGKTAVLTEYQYNPDVGSPIAGLWVQGLGVVAATLTQIDMADANGVGVLEMTCAQSYVGGSGAYVRVSGNVLQPWGAAVALLAQASRGATAYQKLSFTAGSMGAGSLAAGQGLMGAAFSRPDTSWGACLLNTDSVAYTVTLPSALQGYTGSQIATTIGDTSVSPSAISGTTTITLPAFSVTDLEVAASSTPAPTVTKVTPAIVSSLGGAPLTVTGSGFSVGTPTVAVGGTAATGVSVTSDTQLTATAPAHAAGAAVDVTVTTTGGTSSTGTADQVAVQTGPVVNSISPTTGSTSGGTTVTINGSGFGSSPSVKFGSVAGTNVQVNSQGTQLTVVTPAHNTPNYHTTVTNGANTSATTPADLFTFTQPNSPTVGGVSPSTGRLVGGDQTVTVTGTNFEVSGSSVVTGVAFGANAATSISVLSSTSLTCVPPAGAGTVDVTVTTSNGTSPTSSADQYVYFSPVPTVTSLGTTSGTTAGGTAVQVNGTGFLGATGVKFGTTAATSVVVVSDTEITCVSPAGSAGSVDVTVTTGGGTSTTSSADQFTYTTSGLSSITVTGPKNILAGDLIEIGCAWAGTGITMTTPTGYTLVPSPTPAQGFCMALFRKYATSADATASAAGTLTATLATSGPTEIVAVMRADYNNDQTAPYDPAPTVSGQINPSSTTVAGGPGMTTTKPNGRIVVFMVSTAASGGTPPAITLPANFVARGSQTSTSKTAALNLSILTGDLNLGTPGATGAINGSVATACPNGCMAVVIKAGS